MNQDGTAHFEEIRIRNRRLLRNLMRNFKQIGKTEIAKLSGLSIPTVAAALKDLMDMGEVLELVGTVSNGGRPGAIYSLNPAFQYAACGYLEESQMKIHIYNVFGEVIKVYEKPLNEETSVGNLAMFFEEVKAQYPQLSLIVLGIPGVIWEGQIEHLPCFPKLQGVALKERLERSLEVAVLLENDINAIAYAGGEQYKDFAHIFLSQGCIGMGLMLGGKLIRGAHGCAGELENVCDSAKDLYAYLSQAICIISAVVDVPRIFLSGTDTEGMNKQRLMAYLEEKFPKKRLPMIEWVENERMLYQQGLWKMALDEWKTK